MEPVDIVLKSLSNDIRQVDILSHNIANANTPGFQSSEVFSLYQQSTGASQLQSVVRANEGNLIHTERPLDVAIVNQGFLLVQDNGEPLLTRYGRMHTDADGMLRHVSGALVMGEAGPIQLPDGNVAISQDGRIMVSGQEVERLVQVEPQNLGTLERTGNGLYRSASLSQPVTPELQQGAVNAAEVAVSRDMVKLIELSRHTESLQRALQAMDQIADAGINELGRR